MSFQDIETIRKNTSLKLDVHMMMYNPGRYIERYAEFGADIIYIHPDSETIPTETLCRIRKLGKAPGIVINPGISLDSIQELLSLVDCVLVMTVNPGFAGRDWEILERLWKKGVEGFVLGKQILFEKNEDYRIIIQKVRNI